MHMITLVQDIHAILTAGCVGYPCAKCAWLLACRGHCAASKKVEVNSLIFMFSFDCFIYGQRIEI